MSSFSYRIIFFVYLLIGSISKLLAQPYSIVLGRPTEQSVTISALLDLPADVYFKYGMQPGFYTDSTIVYSTLPSEPLEADLVSLVPDSRYFYQMCYRFQSTTGYTLSPEYTFHTQRSVGSSFTFTIEADEHLYDKKGIPSMYCVTLGNEALDQPDFMLSLGDIWGDDHDPDSMSSYVMDTLHRYYRPFLGSICHSIPFYACLGNHEGENDYYLAQTPPNNLAAWGTQARKKYFPNPSPSNFYSGNTTVEPFGIGTPENYYAWTWGNALFVVLDVYRDQCDTSAKPQKWSWSLGQPQYDWLKAVLDTSVSQYKFVFAHHINGQGRGGITNAVEFEWGGYNSNHTTYDFPNERPGWAAPIHQLFVNAGVNVFFQGHDHLFAHETLDGVTYQEVPMPSDSTYEIGMLANADAYTSDTIGGTGHIRVNVTPQCVTVDFVRAYLPVDTVGGLHQNREIGFSYTLGSCATNDISVNDAANLYRLYPVPASDRLHVISPPGKSIKEARIFNAMGQCVVVSESTLLNVAELKNGMYFLLIDSSDMHTAKKFIVQH